MIWNRHSARNLGDHALLSPSNYHWTNYTEDKLEAFVKRNRAAALGTRKHALAAELIALGQKLPAKPKTTLSLYVNDAIGWRMAPEKVLYYSRNCWGTADAISFRASLLRIHDLKTGTSLASMKQLKIYAALFCWEYGVSPFDIKISLRLYQNNDFEEVFAEPHEIIHLMDVIKVSDRIVEDMRWEDDE